MARLRSWSCCLCVRPKTATILLGVMGILLGVILIVPFCVLLENQDFYIREFVKNQRAIGTRDYSDDEILKIHNFYRILWGSIVGIDVLYILSCVLIIAGVAAERHLLLLPWLFVSSIIIGFLVVIILSVMFAFADSNAVIVLCSAAPILGFAFYSVYIVYIAYNQLKVYDLKRVTAASNMRQSTTSREDERVHALLAYNRTADERNIVSPSASNSTLDSIKGSIQRVMGGTPPPPYETVAMESKEDIPTPMLDQHAEASFFSTGVSASNSESSRIDQSEVLSRGEDDDDVDDSAEMKASESDKLIDDHVATESIVSGGSASTIAAGSDVIVEIESITKSNPPEV